MDECGRDAAAHQADGDAAFGPAAAEPGRERPTLQLILLLAGVTAIGPFALQSVAPALPTLAKAFSVSESAAQSLISLAMFGMAAGAVVYGPLSDHFGRRPVLLGGMILATLGALLAFLAPAFELALVGRIAQAVGAGAGMVLARAAAQDLFGPRGAAAVIAQVTAAMALAPMLAPAIGGMVTQLVGWRGIFGAIMFAALGLTIWAYLRFRETARVFSPTLELGAAARDYQSVLARPSFQANAAYASLSLASFFLFVSAGPYVLERAYGLGPAAYGGLFIGAALVYILSNLASPHVTARLGHAGALKLGGALSAAGGGLAGSFLWFWGVPGPEAVAGGAADWVGGVALMLGLSLNSIGTGVAMPNAIAASVAAYPERTGSASSLLSVLQFSAAGLSAQAATLLPLDRGAPLCVAMAAVGVSALVFYLARRPQIG